MKLIKKNVRTIYLTNSASRNYHNEKYKKLDIKIKEAKKYVSKHKLRDNECNICGFCFSLVFHHTNYEKNEGFTTCNSCHKLYCKEGRCFEDSLRLYKEGVKDINYAFAKKPCPSPSQ